MSLLAISDKRWRRERQRQSDLAWQEAQHRYGTVATLGDVFDPRKLRVFDTWMGAWEERHPRPDLVSMLGDVIFGSPTEPHHSP